MLYHDFAYLTDDGRNVVVEVDFSYSSPDPYNTSSDWDARGGVFIEGYTVFEEGKPVNVEIPVIDLLKEIKDCIRDGMLEVAQLENQSF